MNTTQSIVVGVTGRGENTDALAFAAREAAARGHGVTLVHAVAPLLVPPPPSVLLTDPSWDEVARRMVEEAAEELREIADVAVPVATEVVHGSPGAALPEVASDASLVVLQHRDLSRLHRVVTGSTVAAVAAHARCPVVAVPPGSRSQASSTTVTVGVHADGGPPELLEAAFAEAALHGWSVRVCHAWRLASPYEQHYAGDDAWRSDVETALRSACEGLVEKYPEVGLETVARYDFPADVLVELSDRSSLLVLGRHGRRGPLPPRLGSLARAAVTHARCPVMVVPV